MLDKFPQLNIDHITPRTKLPLGIKAGIFLLDGYEWVCDLDYLAGGWEAEVYALSDQTQPVVFVDRAYPDERGLLNNNVISGWIDNFPEGSLDDYDLHHIALRVDELDWAIDFMCGHGFEFSGDIQVGVPGKLLQIFLKSELVTRKEGEEPVVGGLLELIQRDFTLPRSLFIDDKADGLMKASV